MNQGYEKSRQYVGIDLHRRRSVIVRMDGEGKVVDCVRIDNSVPALVAQVAKAGPRAPVAVEATYGWYWAVDALSEAGFAVTLAHPPDHGRGQHRSSSPSGLWTLRVDTALGPAHPKPGHAGQRTHGQSLASPSSVMNARHGRLGSRILSAWPRVCSVPRDGCGSPQRSPSSAWR